MFTFIGGGETTKDDVEAQQLQETQEEAQQLQETQEENLATTPSSGFQLVPLEEKKGKSVTFNVDKSFQEDPEREDAGDKPEEDTKTQSRSTCTSVMELVVSNSTAPVVRVSSPDPSTVP